MKKEARTEIPRKAVYRLSVYLRCLHRLENNGIHTVSSEVLARAAGVKSTQLRKDLTYFGQFGTRGLGYEVQQLTEMISNLLGTKGFQPVVIVGVGNLGRALLSYRGFEREGFEIVGAFDLQPDRYLVEQSSVDESAAKSQSKVKLAEWLKAVKIPIEVKPMEALPKVINEHLVKLAVLCVPPKSAQEVVNQLIEHGVLAILNFSPIVLSVPDEVTVNNVNLAMELENLSYFINE